MRSLPYRDCLAQDHRRSWQRDILPVVSFVHSKEVFALLPLVQESMQALTELSLWHLKQLLLEHWILKNLPVTF
jgi:hypothetical protein